MKKVLILLSVLLLTVGCSKEIKFEIIEKNTTEFHEIDVAEKINDGILYYNGNKVIYEKNNNIIEISNNVKSLWRENDDIYYISNDILYNYNLKTKIAKEMVKNPYNILGKYKGNIISYYGRSIYSINGTTKTKIFKNGYYLNNAVLYKNKVYGIPATNVYEYNLDTLQVNKVTKNKHNYAYIIMIEDNLYIITSKYKNKHKNMLNYTYFKVTEKGLEKDFSINNTSQISSSKIIKGGLFIGTTNDSDNNAKGNKLLYIKNGKSKTIDKNYFYEIIGIFDNKLLYYKNKHFYGTYGENLITFYLYNGKNSTKAFDLDVNYFECIRGYEYEDNILIEVTYESSTHLYKYDGKTIKEIDTPKNFFRIIALDIIDNKAYITYSDAEESASILGTIIDLK